MSNADAYRNVILQGDVRERLAEVPDGVVQCVVTSIPYWGLRDYGIPPVVWGPVHRRGAEDAETCEHEWGDALPDLKTGRNDAATRNAWQAMVGLAAKPHLANDGGPARGEGGAFCCLCGAWRGSLGLEPTIDLFVQHVVEVFREVGRVMRDDGTLWLNVGDAYSGSANAGGEETRTCNSRPNARDRNLPTKRCSGLKPKDLIGQPWRVAFALQADGWYLRSAIVWAKGLSFCPTYSGSVMPESCADRPTSAYEMVFLLTKRGTYYYDQEAVKEEATYGNHRRTVFDNVPPPPSKCPPHKGLRRAPGPESGRNLRNVWAIGTEPTSEKHFAAFPKALVRPCILAGTSERGACPQCGTPWERVVERSAYAPQTVEPGVRRVDQSRGDKTRKLSGKEFNEEAKSTTLGWRPGCACSGLPIIEDQPPRPTEPKRKRGTPADEWAAVWSAYCADLAAWEAAMADWRRRWADLKPQYADLPVVPCLAADPFGGTGTVGVVAQALGRDYPLTELNPDYCAMARARLANHEGLTEAEGAAVSRRVADKAPLLAGMKED